MGERGCGGGKGLVVVAVAARLAACVCSWALGEWVHVLALARRQRAGWWKGGA